MKLMKISKFIFPAAIAFVMFVTAFALYSTVSAYLTADVPTPVSQYRAKTFFATTTAMTWYATTTSATSTNITAYNDDQGRIDNGALDIRGAESVTWYFSRGGKNGANTGSSRFNVQVSPDCAISGTWYDYSKLMQATSTVTQSSATITAATSTLVYTMDLRAENYSCARVVVVETTDGDHAASATVSY